MIRGDDEEDDHDKNIVAFMDFVKVIVVGGGVAGLAAAKTLGSHVDFVLLEANDYLGGRIRTIDLTSDVTIDLGAQFIHGQTNNRVYQILEELGCILPDVELTEKNLLVLTSDQRSIDSNRMIEALAIWQEILDEAQAKYSQQTHSTSDSFGEFFLEQVKRRFPSTEWFNALKNYFEQSELIENGCSKLENLSLAEYGSFEYLPGCYDYQLRNGGYRPLISYLKSFITDSNRIRLNCEVIAVEYLPETRRLKVQIRRDQSMIETMFCEHLIWTSSLGYLKENFHSIFASEKALIEQKQNAIANLGMDTVNKVVLLYDERFWSESLSEIILLHTDEEIEKKFPSSFASPLIRSIHRFDVLPSSDLPVLICWFGGTAAILLEDYSDESAGDICHEVLCYYLKISSDLHRPRRVVKSGWHRNRFSRGSYSYYSTKSPRSDGGILRQSYSPDKVVRIQFAGEATHDRFYSTVHGALESGIREANQLLTIIDEEK